MTELTDNATAAAALVVEPCAFANSEAISERLLVLSARSDAGTATPEELVEWTELSVTAREVIRAKGVETCRALAISYFSYLAAQFGEESAREAWKLALPKRGRGQPVSEAKRRRDAVTIAMDATNRELGMGREKAADRALDKHMDPHDKRRTIDRMIRARAKPLA